MNRFLYPAMGLVLFSLMGCMTESKVVEPDPVTPVAADTARNVYAFRSPAAASAVSDLFAFQTPASTATAADVFAFVTLAGVKTISDLRSDSTAPAFTYFSLATGAAVADSNAAWDLAFRSTTIKVNGKGQILSGAEFDKLAEAPDSGYSETLPAWYDYSGEPNHTITPKAGAVIVVKTPGGKYAKIEIASYYKGRPSAPNGLVDTAKYYSFRYLLQPDGSRSLIAAANPAPSTYFSFKTGKVAEDSTSEWDLAFRSTGIRVNGKSQLLTGTDFDKLLEAPEEGYAEGSPTWYDYSGEPNHTITPKAETVVAIKTAAGQYAKVQITSYYKGSPASPDGLKDTARYYSFRYLIQPDGSHNLKSAANPAPPTYFSFTTGKVVVDSTEGWDLAFRSTGIRVSGKAQIVSGTDFDKLVEAPEAGYAEGSLPAWYDYSGEPNHTITPKANMVLAVKTSDGKYAKVQITNYYKGSPDSPDGLKDTARYYSFRYLLQADGSRNLAGADNPAPPTYFSLKAGKVVEDSTQAWDLAFRSTTIRANGTAQLLDATDFDLLTEAPESGYSSGSLPAWYDYSGDPNHTITPKLAKVIVVKTLDGKYAKFQILSYYKDAPAEPLGTRDAARYYTFRYVYQSDSSRKLK